MKKILILCTALLCLQGCAQEKKEPTMNILTTQERLSYIKSHILHYGYEPLFYIETESNLNYQILVNDFPVYTHFKSNNIGMTFNINQAILKSGEQKLEIKVFPGYINETTQNKFLDNQGKLRLIIYETSWRKDGGGQEEPKTILEYELPKENKHTGWTIDYSKLKSFTDSLSFEAKVPYTLKGWTDGEVFKEEDSLQLKAQVVAFYRDIINAYQKKEWDYINTKYLYAETEWYQSEYFSDDTIENVQNTLKKNENKINRKFFPLEDLRLAFYGDNRILRLEWINGKNKGRSALTYTYENEEREGTVYLDLYLHRPKGSSQFQIIR
ncbi:hypothetical protein [Apibacter adventoris]|uniref:Lipoprotein n=1 Tax=Apibacter adventoris TaxID=1679466 RepID=A0A2S8A8M0_9FLAO|nr:hypothetical protein [Apibacter adventoris]PQL90911.1 hypothetical protein C4S77_09595 [Apibacter adventoris]